MGNTSTASTNPNGVQQQQQQQQVDTEMNRYAAHHTMIDQDGNITDNYPDFLRPSDAYIPPTSGFFFGQIGDGPSLINFLPDKFIGDRLVARYFAAVHPIARCVHKQSFEALYDGFWLEVLSNIEPRASVQAVVFAAWFSACVSMEEEEVQRDYGWYKTQLVEKMKVGAESALARANFLRTTKVETLQAFVMYMVSVIPERHVKGRLTTFRSPYAEKKCLALTLSSSAPPSGWPNVWASTETAKPSASTPWKRTSADSSGTSSASSTSGLAKPKVPNLPSDETTTTPVSP